MIVPTCLFVLTVLYRSIAQVPLVAQPRASRLIASDIASDAELSVLISGWERQDAEKMAEQAARFQDSSQTNDIGSDRLRNGREQMATAGLKPDDLLKPDMLPSTPYDPAVATARFASEPMSVGMRQMELVGPLLAFLGRVVIDVRRGQEEKHRQLRAAELTTLISGLGPAIIKAGQALSSRSDLLPAEYLAELSRLQDRVPQFSNDEAFGIIEAELGSPPSRLFAAMQPEPLAAASLGQVYKATLHDGREVAVKVQRPGCEQTIALDLYILRAYSASLTSLIAMLGREIDLVSVIDDFGVLIYAEIDYTVEASNARRFRQLYGSIPNVSAPEVITELSSRRVMVTEWVDGFRLTDRAALLANRLEPAALVDTLVQCSMRQMLQNGFFHADPHAGNLLVTSEGILVYIDFGMMSFLGSEQRFAIIEAVVHLVNRDFLALADLYKTLGFIPLHQDTEPIASALNEALPDVLNASVSELNFKSVIDKLGDVMYKYPFSLPPFYIAIIRCLGVLEGVALQVDSDFAIIKDAYPYIASRLLTDRSPQLQRALVALIFKDGKLRWDYFEALIENAAETNDYDALAAVEQLADYVLSPTANELLEQLVEQVIEALDQLGADTALYIYRAVIAAAAEVSSGGESAVANGLVAGLGVGRGNVQPADMGAAFEALSGTPLPESTRRALRLLQSLQSSAADANVDLSRAGTLALTILSQRRVQRLLADFSLQLTERAVRRTIQLMFNLPTITPATNPSTKPESL
mmetsp:Transcript_54864/g.90965  ORF Transcript_54864/g.90965 Transcript_54864/m.90965 type:complete len:754 (+) Transcript_54864:39-2300(+)